MALISTTGRKNISHFDRLAMGTILLRASEKKFFSSDNRHRYVLRIMNYTIDVSGWMGEEIRLNEETEGCEQVRSVERKTKLRHIDNAEANITMKRVVDDPKGWLRS